MKITKAEIVRYDEGLVDAAMATNCVNASIYVVAAHRSC